MASGVQIRDGLTVMLRYDPDFWAHAEHDVFYGSDTPAEKMSAEDVAKLDELHWFWDEKFDCWQHFT